MNIYKQKLKFSKRSKNLSQKCKINYYISVEVGVQEGSHGEEEMGSKKKKETISARSVSSSSWTQCTCPEKFDYT